MSKNAQQCSGGTGQVDYKDLMMSKDNLLLKRKHEMGNLLPVGKTFLFLFFK